MNEQVRESLPMLILLALTVAAVAVVGVITLLANLG